MKDIFDNIKKAIEKGKTFSIFIHKNPDGDALGSGMALKKLLEHFGKTTYLTSHDKIASTYDFMNLEIEEDLNKIQSADTFFFLDLSAIYRCGKYQDIVNLPNKTIIFIDHHIEQDIIGDIVARNPNKSSTAELVYDLYMHLGVPFTKETATLLYSGIASDTGCFVQKNTTPESLVAASKLIEANADYEKANFELFTKRPDGYLRVASFALKNAKVYGDKLTLLVVNGRNYKKLNKPDTFYLVDSLKHYPTDILVIITRKNKHTIKLNMRSRQTDIQVMCEKFGGGGHKNASGAEISNRSIRSIIKEVKNLILN